MKRIITLFLLTSFILPAPVLAQEDIFYFFDNQYGLSSFKKNHKKIDIIAPQVYEVGEDLKVSKIKEKKLVKEAKKRKVDTMPLIYQSEFSKVLMSTILITPKAQDEIISFMIKEAKKQKYIGWQFDFENINHLDRDMYTAFVKKTYEALKKEGLKFSVAVVVRDNDYDPNSKNQDWSSAYDYAKLAENSDFLSLMTYDDPKSIGPVASLDYVNRVLDYMLTKTSPEKLSLGVPLYCWQWQDGKRVASTTYRLAQKAYNKIKKSERSRGFNHVLGAEFIQFNRDGVNNIIWCDNKESIEIKKNIVKDRGLRGISAWALGQEDKSFWKSF